MLLSGKNKTLHTMVECIWIVFHNLRLLLMDDIPQSKQKLWDLKLGSHAGIRMQVVMYSSLSSLELIFMFGWKVITLQSHH